MHRPGLLYYNGRMNGYDVLHLTNEVLSAILARCQVLSLKSEPISRFNVALFQFACLDHKWFDGGLEHVVPLENCIPSAKFLINIRAEPQLLLRIEGLATQCLSPTSRILIVVYSCSQL
jgi:hypothetical protein